MKRIQEVFQDMEGCEPSEMLRSKILLSIEQERVTRLSQRRLFSVVGLMISAIVFVGSVVAYGEALLQSDFWMLGSLLFSDLTIIVASFQDFSLSLLETLPVVPLFVILVPLSLFFWLTSLFLSFSEKHDSSHFSQTTLAH